MKPTDKFTQGLIDEIERLWDVLDCIHENNPDLVEFALSKYPANTEMNDETH